MIKSFNPRKIFWLVGYVFLCSFIMSILVFCFAFSIESDRYAQDSWATIQARSDKQHQQFLDDLRTQGIGTDQWYRIRPLFILFIPPHHMKTDDMLWYENGKWSIKHFKPTK